MRVALAFNTLDMSQQVFMSISYLNTMIMEKVHQDFTVFYCHSSLPPIKVLTLCTHIDKAFQFDGTIICFDLYTATLIAKTKSRKVLYVNDLEWLRGRGDYLTNHSILTDENFTLICRSESHAKVIKNYCGRDAKVIEGFNLHTIIKFLEEQYEKK